MEKLKNLVDEELEREIQNLKTLQIGTKEHYQAVVAVAELFKARVDECRLEKNVEVEIDKMKQEAELKEAALKIDMDLKQQQIDAEAEKDEKDREENKKKSKRDGWEQLAHLGIDLAGIILPLIGYTCMFNKGLKFEEDGVVSSSFMRNLMGKFKFTRK